MLSKPRQEVRDDIYNIAEEMECLRRIKDIRYELHIIDRVLADQKKVVNDFLADGPPGHKTQHAGRTTTRARRDKLAHELKLRPERVVALEKEADRVEKWVSCFHVNCNSLAMSTAEG